MHVGVRHCVFINTLPFFISSSQQMSTLSCVTMSFNMLSPRKRAVRRIRVDEDGALVNSSEFDRLLIDNDIHLETIGGCGSKLNKS